MLRFNCLQPPLDNAASAGLQAVDQREFLSAYSSDDSILRAGVGRVPAGRAEGQSGKK